MSALRELLARFEIDVDDKKLKAGHEEVDSFVEKLKKAGEVFAEAFAFDKLKEFVVSTVESAAALKDTSVRLGTTTDELQAMQLAASQAGVSNEGLSTSIRFLNKNLAEAVSGGGAASQVFQQLGIAIKNGDGTTRAAGDVMADLADHIASIDDPARQTEVAMKLLGRGGVELIPLLKEGGKAFEEARAQMVALGGGIEEGFIDRAKEADDAMARLRFASTGLKSQIAAALLPVLEKVVSWLTKLVVAGINFAKQTNTVTHALQFVGSIAALKTASNLVTLAKSFGLVKQSAGQSVVAMMKFAAPLALVGLLYLAFDELATLLEGGDTLIGDALGPDKQAFIDNLRGAVDSLKNSFADVGGAIQSGGTQMGAFATIVVDAAKAVAWLVEGLDTVIKVGGKAVEAIADVFYSTRPEEVQATTDSNAATGQSVSAQWRNSPEAKREAAQRAAQLTAPGTIGSALGGFGNVAGVPGFSPLASLPPSFVGPPAPGEARGAVTIQQTNSTSVEVHTTSDSPRAIGDAVGAGVATAQQRANDRAHTALRKP